MYGSGNNQDLRSDAHPVFPLALIKTWNALS
jgi:hypothetical protein